MIVIFVKGGTVVDIQSTSKEQPSVVVLDGDIADEVDPKHVRTVDGERYAVNHWVAPFSATLRAAVRS